MRPSKNFGTPKMNNIYSNLNEYLSQEIEKMKKLVKNL